MFLNPFKPLKTVKQNSYTTTLIMNINEIYGHEYVIQYENLLKYKSR